MCFSGDTYEDVLLSRTSKSRDMTVVVCTRSVRIHIYTVYQLQVSTECLESLNVVIRKFLSSILASSVSYRKTKCPAVVLGIIGAPVSSSIHEQPGLAFR